MSIHFTTAVALPVAMRRYAVWAALAVIVLVGGFLRFYDLSTVPTELIVDELDLYNSVHSIATTGRDLDGTLLPFLSAASPTRNPPMYGIAGYASSLVFGANAFGLRFPAALFGVVAVLLIYGIAFELTRRRDVALAAAFFAATQPIFVHFSRIAWEPSSELPFLLGGIYVLLRTLRRSNGTPSLGGIGAAALLLGLTSYTYMAGWFYAVVLGGGLVLLNAAGLRTRRAWINVAAGGAIWGLVALPALWMWFFDPSTAGKVQRLDTFAPGVNLETLRVFAANYVAHYRIAYLVLNGDPIPGITWRYLNGFGAFFWWVLPLAAAGALAAFAYVRGWGMRAWLWLWLLAYPLGGSLTNEGAPNAPRTLAGAPVFCILAALGFALFMDWAASPRSRRGARLATFALGTLFAAAAVVSTTRFAIFYFTQSVHMASNAWDSGTFATFTAIRRLLPDYDRVCIAIRPAWYGLDTYVRFYLGDEREKVVESVADAACFEPGTLLVVDTDTHLRRPGFKPIETIEDVDGDGFATIRARPIHRRKPKSTS